jgi:hypothetical protein
MGTSLIPKKISQSDISSLTSTPAMENSRSVKQRVDELSTIILTEFEFFCIHLHWAGVSDTLLSAGALPSLINPILTIPFANS